MASSTNLVRSGGRNDQLSFRRFIPKANAINVSFFGLWMIGLFVMFLSPAPVSISESGMNMFGEKMVEANLVDTQDALYDVRIAERRVYNAKVWPWQWDEVSTRRYENEKIGLSHAEERLRELEEKKSHIITQGKRAVGLWSAIGLSEMRDDFWDNFNWGLGLAKGMTIQQAYYAFFRMLLWGSNRDENVLGVLLSWLIRILYNLSIGLVFSLISFVWNVPTLIDSYGASFMESLAFFAVSAIAASSVVLTVLTLMWGSAVGGTYLVFKAVQDHARLNGRRRQFIRNRSGRYGARGASKYD